MFEMRFRRTFLVPLKTGLAAALALIAYRALHLQHGYWAVISAIIVMQSNLGRSLQASGYRLIGTAIGAIVGALTFWMAGRNPAAVFFAVTLTLVICVVAGLQDTMRLAGVTVAIVMLIAEETPWHAGLNRFIDVALGISAAVVVSLLWPSRARKELRRSLAATFEELRDLFASVVACALGENCDPVAIERRKAGATARSLRNSELLADVEREPGTGAPLLGSLNESADRIRDHIYGLDYAGRPMASDVFPQQLHPQLRALFVAIEQAFAAITAELRDQPPSFPLLVQALYDLETRFNELRQAGTGLQYATDEILRFYALFYRLRQLVGELQRDEDFGNALEHSVEGKRQTV